MPSLRIGVDVGGTNTDAAVLDGDARLVSRAKVPTTDDILAGITSALAAVLEPLGDRRTDVTQVTIGTTHALNALAHGHSLRRVAAIRVGSPAGDAVRPFECWPDHLRALVDGGSCSIGGGVELDGRRLGPLRLDGLDAPMQSWRGHIDAVAVTSVFASVDADDELAVAAHVRAVLGPHLPVSLSSEIGSVGLLERENATILNAALGKLTSEVTTALTRAMDDLGMSARAFVTQNDGTAMEVEYARAHAVFTINAGPANALRGALHLSGLSDGVVVDVGGTTTELTLAVDGQAREAATDLSIAGVRTNFRVPQLLTVPVGGGTVVTTGRGGRTTLSGRSVGSHLRERATVFGGDTATLTDAAVADGRVALGSVPPARALAKALTVSDRMLVEAVDRSRLSALPVAVIAVGGAAFLLPGNVPGASAVVRPPDADIANAVGAALADVGGQAERLVRLRDQARTDALAEVSALARRRAVMAGADPAHVRVVQVEEIPLAYLADPALLVRVKAAGRMGEM